METGKEYLISEVPEYSRLEPGVVKCLEVSDRGALVVNVFGIQELVENMEEYKLRKI